MEWGDPRFHVTWQGSSVGQVCVFIGDVLLKSFLCFWLHTRRVALGDARMPCIALTFCVFFTGTSIIRSVPLGDVLTPSIADACFMFDYDSRRALR